MAMSQSVAAAYDGSVEIMVAPGDEVFPGKLLYLITPADGGGCSDEVKAQGFGYIREYSLSDVGDDINSRLSPVPAFCWADDYDGSHFYVRKGTPLFVIDGHKDGARCGGNADLRPRKAYRTRFFRENGFYPKYG